MRAYAAALALLLPLAACGGSPEPDASPAPPATAATADPSAEPAAGWNPCADLAAGRVSSALGAGVTKEDGNPRTPRCAFLPAEKDGPALNVTYLWYGGGFEEAWESMGQIEGRVSDLDVPEADAARLVVNAKRKVLLVTGFVQTGDLIETVNAIALAPYDRAALVAAATDVMTTLARRAPASPEEAARRG